MTHVASALAWGTVIIIGYVYIGYPLLLWVLGRIRERRVVQQPVTFPVTLLVSTFNEQTVIREKLKNCLALDYPQDSLEIIVISDASTDETDRIVEEFAADRVQLLRMPQRGGKTLGLNAAVQKAHGQILVFSDANIMYRPDALRCLLRNFADPTVGCVTGDSRYIGDGNSSAHIWEDAYWHYEQTVRTLESRVGSTVGGDGAIFAIRKELYVPLLAEAINDFVTPLQIVSRGYRAVFDSAAVGFEPTVGQFDGEFRRKRRIVNRSWRGLMSVPDVLKPWRVGIFAWQVWSHKVLRWLTLPLVLIEASACYVAAPVGITYQLGFYGWIGSLMIAVFGSLCPHNQGKIARLAHGVFYFYLVNLAALLGLLSALRGRVETVWTPER